MSVTLSSTNTLWLFRALALLGVRGHQVNQLQTYGSCRQRSNLGMVIGGRYLYYICAHQI